MDRSLPTLLLLALAVGCASRTVRVEVAPAPAVALPTTTVAVVASERECRPTADALVASLGERASIAVDPQAQTRLLVFGCGQHIGWTLTEQVDATGDRTERHQRADLKGRGHAVLAVTTEDGTLAHLLGSARHDSWGAWDAGAMFQSRRAMRKRLTDTVAQDLVSQLNPAPRELDRRIYPNAVEGSARDLQTLAVHAEQRGELSEALRLATAAMAQRPTAQRAAYLQALQRRATLPPPPASSSTD